MVALDVEPIMPEGYGMTIDWGALSEL